MTTRSAVVPRERTIIRRMIPLARPAKELVLSVLSVARSSASRCCVIVSITLRRREEEGEGGGGC